MSGFTQQRRQRIIDDYLAKTGRNTFRPGEFIDWLADKPDHEAYAAFYAIDDAEAARAYRIELARRFVSGLRIVVTENVTESSVQSIKVTGDAPRFISPLSARQDGGGYVAYDPTDATKVQAFRQEAAAALNAWRKRYASVLDKREADTLADLVSAMEKIADPA